ncbi:ribonuclease E activity regulator RraA [Ideonella sp.]|uniref:ribonuclease E activity regulator RraA n=1 Tax=Ideonella sp. TaxID=1929293 RepID=UPI0035B0D30F
MPASSPSTCDLCDRFRDSDAVGFRVLPSVFRLYGGHAAFHGPVRTLRCFEDNALLRERLQTPGDGHVLVVDAGASLRRAVLGGNLAGFAAAQGWAGVLVHGAVRDLAELRAAQVGIAALGHCPLPTARHSGMPGGALDVPVQVAGALVRPGDWLYADEDGVVVSDAAL